MNARRLSALHDMADQAVSPHEAEIARAKLAEMGSPPRPPRPPARASAPAPGPSGYGFTSTTSNASYTSNGAFRMAFVFVRRG